MTETTIKTRETIITILLQFISLTVIILDTERFIVGTVTEEVLKDFTPIFRDKTLFTQTPHKIPRTSRIPMTVIEDTTTTTDTNEALLTVGEIGDSMASED